MEIGRRTFVGAAAAVAAIGITTDAPPAEAESAFLVSTSNVDITPTVGYAMGGYGTDAVRESQAINEPLRARCTILWDSGTPRVIVTADVLAFGRVMHQQIRSRITALGVASSDFVLNATHTHNGPVLREKLDPYISYNISDLSAINFYSDSLVNKITDLVRSALAAPRTSVTLDYFVLDEDFSYNREPPLAYVERDVPVLVARDSAGKPRAVIFSYGTHPVAANLQYEFDPDYPSEAIKTIEAAYPGVAAQFVLGPAGDQDPKNTAGGFIGADAYGRDLGLTITNAIGTPGAPMAGPISTAISEATLPLDITDTPSNLQAVAAAYDARASRTTGYYQRHAQVMADQARTHSFVSTIPLPIQRWKFSGANGLTMIFCGGEVVSGYAVYFRRQLGGSARLWFTAYANEVPAYIPSDELLDHASYGGGWDADSPGLAGGSMTIYKYMGHFLGRSAGTTTNGVEQVVIAKIQALL